VFDVSVWKLRSALWTRIQDSKSFNQVIQPGAIMNKQHTSPRPFFRLLSAGAVCLLIGSGFSSAIAAPNADACALLNSADLTTLLGGMATAKGNAGGGCNWTASGSKRKLLAINYKNHAGFPSEQMYMGARQNAHGKVTDESGIGDKAFSVMPGSGLVVMIMIKHGRMLQLQYWTGTPETAKDLDTLRPVAKKAIAAF
jgi:hypothetical protein